MTAHLKSDGLYVRDDRERPRRMLKKFIQQGRSE